MQSHILEEIGLTKGEISVYFALLEVGSSTVGPIIDKAKVSSSKVYDILERLIDKGLVSYINRENRKFFKAASPQRIKDYLQEKQKKIQEQEQEVEKILPELLLKQELSKKTQEVNIYEGFKGVKTAHEKTLQELKKGEEFYFMGASVLSSEKLKNYWQDYHSRREKKQIATKILFNADVDKKELDNRNSFNYCHARYMPFQISTPSWIEVFRDTTVLGVPSENPISVEIKNEQVADSFRAYFEALWNQKVQVYEGEGQAIKFFEQILTDLKAGEEYFVINANKGHEKTAKLKKFFPQYHKKREQKGIKVNMLLNDDMKHYPKLIQLKKEEYKFLPAGFRSPLQMTFYKDKLYITLWESNVISFLIQDAKVVQAIKAYFDSLWNQDVQIVRGLDEIEKFFEDILEEGGIDFIGARGYFVDARPDYIEEWEKRAKAKRIRIRNIVDSEIRGRKITLFPFARTKYTLSAEFSKLSVFWIFKEKVVISNWMDDEPIAIIMNNKNIRDVYKQQFDLLWNQEMVTLQGKQAVEELCGSVLEQQQDLYLIGANASILENHREFFAEWDQKRVKAGIQRHHLSIEETRGSPFNALPNSKVKYLPAQFKSPLVIWVFGNKVAQVLWDKSIVFLIDNQELAQDYRKYFDFLWENSKD